MIRAIPAALIVAGAGMLILPLGTILVSVLPSTVGLQVDPRGLTVLLSLSILGASFLASGIWAVIVRRRK